MNLMEYICSILGMNYNNLSDMDMAYLQMMAVPFGVAIIGFFKSFMVCVFNLFQRKG